METFVQPYFYADINGAPYELKGKTKPFHDSKETNVEIRVTDLNLPHYISYAPVKLNFKVPSAFLDASLRIRFIQSKDHVPTLSIDGDISLRKLAVNDLNNRLLLRIPDFQVTLSSFEPFTRIIDISKVVIQSPEVNVSREKDGSVNVIKILTFNKDRHGNVQTFAVKIDEIQLSNGKFHFSDFSKGRPFTTTLHPVDFKVERFTNRKGENSHYALTARIESGEEMAITGEFSFDPLRVHGNLALRSVPVRKYAPYYKDIVACEIERGLLNLSTEYLYSAQGEKPEISMSKASLDVKDIYIRTEDKANDLFKVSSLAVRETDLYLTKRELRIGRIQTEKGKIRVVRQKNGSINLLQVIPQIGSVQKGSKEGDQKKEEKGWLISLKEVAVEQYQVEISDLSLRTPASLTIEGISLRGENISTARNSKGKPSLSLLVNKKGRIGASGAIGLQPIEANLKVDLMEIPFSAFQPHISERLRIQAVKGSLSANGDLPFSLSDEKEAKASLKGDLKMRQFASAEKKTGEDILKWDSLDLEGFQFDLSPFRLDVKRISLTDFYARIQLYPDGKLNLHEIFVEEAGQKEIKEGKKGSPKTGSDRRIDNKAR